MEENKYRYNDISERLRRMNRIYMGATIFMAALILLYLWMKQMNHNIKTVTVYGNTVLLLAFTVVNAVIYCRNKATSKLKVAVTMEMGIEYLLIGMQTDAHFITYILIVSLALQIPYYDKKGLRRTFNWTWNFIYPCDCCTVCQGNYCDRCGYHLWYLGCAWNSLYRSQNR